MVGLFSFLLVASGVALVVALVLLAVRAVKKKPKKPVAIAAAVCAAVLLVSFVGVGVTYNPTPEQIAEREGLRRRKLRQRKPRNGPPPRKPPGGKRKKRRSQNPLRLRHPKLQRSRKPPLLLNRRNLCNLFPLRRLLRTRRLRHPIPKAGMLIRRRILLPLINPTSLRHQN